MPQVQVSTSARMNECCHGMPVQRESLREECTWQSHHARGSAYPSTCAQWQGAVSDTVRRRGGGAMGESRRPHTNAFVCQSDPPKRALMGHASKGPVRFRKRPRASATASDAQTKTHAVASLLQLAAHGALRLMRDRGARYMIGDVHCSTARHRIAAGTVLLSAKTVLQDSHALCA